jgi:DNA-binding NarL/FixJ family response regulator
MASARYSQVLSEFEARVLFGMLQGRKHTVIAEEFGCTWGMVKSAATRIYDKLGASNKVEAIQMAIARGVLDSYGYWGA